MKKSSEKKKKHIDCDLKIPFQHLAPNNNVDDKATFAALDYALEQDSVKNIAVTGTYGSGKSSVLSSYVNKRKNHGFLNISLATFVLETDDVQNAETASCRDTNGQLRACYKFCVKPNKAQINPVPA